MAASSSSTSKSATHARTQSPARSVSQYHHFIPRFILRNFADPTQVLPSHPANGVQAVGKKNKGRKMAPQKMMPGSVDLVLKLLDLEEGKLTQSPLSRTFGCQDLYRDFDSSQPDQHHLEKQLSKLESRAGEVLANVKKAFDSGAGEVQIKRGELDVLRKFLFIMLYRGSAMGNKRFNVSIDEYAADDRVQMMAYMREKKFEKPIGVWFANIQAFLDVEMDREGWESKLMTRAYPFDALWFVNNVKMFFLCFCTPKSVDDEFVLTENAYGIFEGPNEVTGLWTDYHTFAPISPKLMIVLRSTLLRKDMPDDETSASLQSMLNRVKEMHMNPDTATSCLEDLPVHIARNNYSRIVNGRPEALPTKMRRENHVYYFPFFPLFTTHAQRINWIMLEEAMGTSALVYKSPVGLRKALDEYLRNDEHKPKVYLSQYLHVLHTIARELGSTVGPLRCKVFDILSDILLCQDAD